MKPIQKSFFFSFCLILIMMAATAVEAQVAPACCYDFDDDDFVERTGNYSAATSIGSLGFDCGVGENSRSVVFTGAPDSLILDPRVKGLFDETFTLSFSFWLEPGTRSYTLFAIQDSCELDSSLVVTYSNALDELKIQMSADISSSIVFTSPLDMTRCWHDLVFLREGETFSFYLDGELVETSTYTDDVTLGRDFDVTVGFSDCVPRRDDYLNGRIDAIKIYDTALGLNDIIALNQFPDQIISRDTTLFEGDSYDLEVGATCAPDFTWRPVTGLSDANVLAPTASPTVTTTYQLEFDHGRCIALDEVTVFIVKDEDIDCSEILFPTAFTPNGDRLNDTYGISNKFIITELERFEIYDRWGMKLFETNDKNGVWDGTYEGNKMMPSSYVYKIEYQCKDQTYRKSGRFNLIK